MNEHTTEGLALLRQIQSNQQQALALQTEQLELVKQQFALVEQQMGRAEKLQGRAEDMQAYAGKAIKVVFPAILVLLGLLGYVIWKFLLR